MRRLALCLAALALVAGALAFPRGGAAQTASLWTTFHGDFQRSGISTVSGPTTGTALNDYRVPYSVHSAAAIGPDGTAYMSAENGTVGSLYAFSPSLTTGYKWAFNTNARMLSSPTVSRDGSVVYVGSDDSHLYAVNTSDGSQKWAAFIGEPVRVSPVLSTDGSLVFVATLGGTILALNAADGSVRWKLSCAEAVNYSPALSADGSLLYVPTYGGHLWAIPANASGPTGGGCGLPFTLDTGAASSPAVGPDGNIYIQDNSGELESFSPTSQAPRWVFILPNRMTTPSTPTFANGNAVLGAADGYVLGVSMQTGQQVWQFKTNGPVESSPAYAAGNSMLYVGSDDGGMYGLTTTATGVTQAFDKISSGPIISSPSIAPDGTVWYGSTGGLVQRLGALPAINPVPATRTPGPTSTPTVTPTAGPTNTPTATSTPTATPTPVQVPLTVSVAKATVKPGQKETITVTTAPSTKVRFRVEYPNGDHQSASKTSDASGKVTYSYKQSSSKIKHNKFVATVVVKAGSGTSENQATAAYKIKFGAIDVSAEPRSAKVGGKIGIFVHAYSGARVSAYLLAPSGRFIAFHGHTGPKGFAHFVFKVTSGLTTGGDHKVTVLAKLDAQPNVQTKTTFTVK